MNANIINEFVTKLPPCDIAGILCACGYALRENTTLFAALDELGFENIDTSTIDDVFMDTEISELALFCSAFTLKTLYPFGR